MALIKCSECGKDVSDTVAICPHCGIEIKKDKMVKISPTINKINIHKSTDIILIIILSLYSLVCIINCLNYLHDLKIFTAVQILLSFLENVLICLSMWGLFVYYKTNIPLIKYIAGAMILISICLYSLDFVKSFFNDSSMILSDIKYLFSNLVTSFTPILLLYFTIKGDK